MQESLGVQLLIAEDSAIVRERLVSLAGEYLKPHAIQTAATGADALAAFDRSQPDAVLLDIGLPDMSGLAVLEHIRRQDASTEVIVFTNSNGPEMVARCHLLGADHFVDKAQDVRPVIESLRTIAQPRDKETSANAASPTPPSRTANGSVPPERSTAKPVSLLIVEDDVCQASPLVKLLERKLPPGSTIAQARSLIPALGLMKANTFHVVLLDLGLPDCEGVEALVAVRHANADAAIIVLTAADDEATVESAMVAGADDYFVKGEIAVTGLTRAIIYAAEGKRSERALSAALESRTRIMDSSADVICTLDAAGRFAEVGAASARIWGYDPADLVGHNVREWVADEDLAKTEAFFKSLRSGEIVREFENRFVRSDGSSVPMMWSGAWSDSDRLMYCVARDITSRKRNEETLRATIESALDCIITIDESDTILQFNPAAEQTFGWSRAEAVGRSMAETIIPPQSRAGHMHGMARLLATGQSRLIGKRIEINALRRDGAEFPVELTVIRVGDDRPARFTAFIRDISERVAAREKLEAQEEQYRVLFESNPNAMWVYEPQTLRILAVNEAAVAQYGYSREELLHLTLFDVRPADERDRLANFMSAGVVEGRAGTWRHARKDGSLLLVDVFSSPTIFQGRAAGMIVLIDVTEKTEAEEKLSRSHQLLQAVTEGTNDAVFAKDAQGRYLMINTAGAQFLGKTPDEVIGRDDCEFFDGETLERILARDREIITSGETRSDENESTAGGITRTYFSTKGPLRNAAGQLIGVVGYSRDVSERKQFELALREERQFLATLIDNVSEGIVSCDTAGVITLFNSATRELHGLPGGPIPEDEWAENFDLYLPDGKTLMKKEQIPLFRALTEGAVKDVQMVIAPRGGKHRRILASGRAFFNEQGDKAGAVVAMHDITERQEVQDALRRSESNLALAQSVSHTGSWEILLDSTTAEDDRDLHWSEEQFRVFGFAPGAVWPTQSFFFSLVHPDDRAMVGAAFETAVAGDIPYDIEHRIIWPDGSVREIHERAEFVRDRDTGALLRIIGTSQDVTEHNKVERKLKDQAEMLDLAQDAIVIRRFEDRIITFWNKGAERLYGWTASEAIGRCIADLYYKDQEDYLPAVNAVESTGEFVGEVHQVAKDGRKLIVSVRSNVIRNSDGTPRSVLIIQSDITDHKKLENQFLRAQRLESIGTLASGVAHDLNNVLAPILMSAPLLRDDVPAALKAKIIDTIESSAERGAQIVKQVLTFARGVEGERVLLDPRHLLKEIVDVTARTFPKTIQITSRVGEDVAFIQGDPTQLHQVLLNLAVNARDAMPTGGKLVLSAENFEVDEHYAAMTPGTGVGSHVLINVSDTGAGIPPHVLEKMFDPFFTTKEIGKGTGLGLSTVLGIVKSHHGTINAYSTPSGTTFRVLLPAAQGMLQLQKAGVPDVPVGAGEIILVVDDELAIREVAKVLLERNGYQVLLADDGPSALAIFAQRQGEIALVLTDYLMPIMNGRELVRIIRKMSSDAQIILSTGRDDDCGSAELDALGVAAALTKPYTQATLLRTLHRVLHAEAKP
ncbi:MAG: PAS domain S-box protein [Acidobacteria bacterium]|nr:PAS domain S-box protein [Acidobacteriota bacterium]